MIMMRIVRLRRRAFRIFEIRLGLFRQALDIGHGQAIASTIQQQRAGYQPTGIMPNKRDCVRWSLEKPKTATAFCDPLAT